MQAMRRATLHAGARHYRARAARGAPARAALHRAISGSRSASPRSTRRPQIASAQVFLNVLRDGLDARARGGRHPARPRRSDALCSRSLLRDYVRARGGARPHRPHGRGAAPHGRAASSCARATGERRLRSRDLRGIAASCGGAALAAACACAHTIATLEALSLSADLFGVSAVHAARAPARADAGLRGHRAVGFRSRRDLRPARAASPR